MWKKISEKISTKAVLGAGLGVAGVSASVLMFSPASTKQKEQKEELEKKKETLFARHVANPVLLRASKTGNYFLANLALHIGANPNTHEEIRHEAFDKDPYIYPFSRMVSVGYAPLHHACENSYFKIAELLLNCGADINDAQNLGRPVYVGDCYSSRFHHSHFLRVKSPYLYDGTQTKTITKHDARQDALYLPRDLFVKQDSKNLHLVHSRSNLQSGNNVLDADFEYNNLPDTPDYFTSTVKEFEELAQEDVGDTPLHLAVRKNDLKLVELLRKRGADVRKKDFMKRSPLFYAITMHRDEDILDELMCNTPVVEFVTDSYLVDSIRFNNKYAFDRILSDIHWHHEHAKKSPVPDGSVNHFLCHPFVSRNKNVPPIIYAGQKELKEPPLHHALGLYYYSRENLQNYVMPLVEHGVDLSNSKDSLHFTPLHLTAMYSHLNERWDDNNDTFSKTKNNDTRFRPNDQKVAAFIKSWPELLIKKIGVNAQTLDGLTPLHLACRAGNLEMVQILLDHGADPNIKDVRGLYALDYAAGNQKYFKDMEKVMSSLSVNPSDPQSLNEREITQRQEEKYMVCPSFIVRKETMPLQHSIHQFIKDLLRNHGANSVTPGFKTDEFWGRHLDRIAREQDEKGRKLQQQNQSFGSFPTHAFAAAYSSWLLNKDEEENLVQDDRKDEGCCQPFGDNRSYGPELKNPVFGPFIYNHPVPRSSIF